MPETLTTHGKENQGIMYSVQAGLLVLNFVPVVGEVLDAAQVVGMVMDHIDPEGYVHVLTRDSLNDVSNIIYETMDSAMTSNIPTCSNLFQNAIPSIDPEIATETCKSLMQIWKPAGPVMSSIESCYGDYTFPNSLSRTGAPKYSCPAGYTRYYNNYYNGNLESYKTNNTLKTPNNIVKSLPIPTTIRTTNYNYKYLTVSIALCFLLIVLFFITILYNI